MITRSEIPKEVQHIADTLEHRGFEAYLVGGCVRDLLIGKTPKDWDITTTAHPTEIESLFPETFLNNDYGTVGIVNPETEDPTLKVVEVTPYRTESEYSDSRRPDSVNFGVSLEEDLKRRDFTVNAIAYRLKDEKIVDLFNGEKDILHKRLRAVGTASERFQEDALRMMRAVRLAVELGFVIESDTMSAIAESSDNLGRISKERIRDEFTRILNSKQPMQGIILLEKLKLLTHVAPDLLRGIGVAQNQAHAFDVYEHLLRTMQHAADKDWEFDIRLAGLYHDISKPETRRWSKEKNDWTFHGHEVVGARVAKKALQELKFPRERIDRITTLIRWHMFFSDPAEITLSAVRRTIANVGQENIWDLLKLRRCDRIGTGRPKEQPFRLRKYTAMVEEALRDPISVKMLKIDGSRIMEITNEKPSKKLGDTLNALLEEVLDDPLKNTTEYLEKRALELMAMTEIELDVLGKKGKDKKEKEEAEAVAELHKKHKVT
ncbi:MAG: HD domain-containing protein [Candidatus Pacebacteria bacterium]|nr:HD domain-containing protein [Candidatus Paceibacterota bacterium]MCF7857349.1 HD domain-containing protein [Candidatus Paceibacterota bacterium]